ncbi:MFS transporter [Sphingomonas sp. TF3]|uniref:MFS transporter n=1 Tax=Sphingomonas sp. TF3 TaxID=2495580 RepID=UPI000F86FF88|nr:MFS transporter [Sphingomonas sp. TF3]RUN77006.1 MFS transporter [Sphingomonas sp. TF3]
MIPQVAPCAAAPQERPDDTRRRWFILILIALGVMISFIDRTSLSAALAAPEFKRQFALSDLDRGWVNSAFFWSYAVLQVPLGWVVDRYGVKWPYAICFALWCAATIGIAFVGSFAGLIAMRLVVGAAEAIVVPASWRWMRTHFKERQSGTAVGIFMFGTKIGPALGAPLAAWLIVVADWRAMFLVLGAAGLIWLVPWVLCVRNDFRRDARPARVGAPALSARRLLASPLIWGTLVVNFCYNYFAFYCMTWMPAYLVEQRHLSLERMGLYAFFSFAGIAMVALAAGWAADRLIDRGHDAVLVRKAFTIAGFAIASTVVLSAYATSLNVALFWNVASLSGLGLATANYNALCRLTLIPASTVGMVTGFQQVATAIAGIVAPILTGWLIHFGGNYTLAIEVIFVFLVIGALTTAFVLKRAWSLRAEDDQP